MSVVDANLPDDDTLVSDLPYYIRETRQAINDASILTAEQQEVNVSDPTPAVTGGIDVIRIIAPYAQDVATIDGGSEGDIVVFVMTTDYVTFKHNTGNIQLNGDPNHPDFVAKTGDILILTYRGTKWLEVARQLDQASAAADERTQYMIKLVVGETTQYDAESEFDDLNTHTADLDKHREINDSGTATTDLWSADKITTELAGKISIGSISGDDIPDGEIVPSKLDALSLPGLSEDGYVPTYNHTAGQFEWEDMSGVVGQDTYMVKWDIGDTAEFLSSKIPIPTGGSGLEVLRINSGATGYELGPTLRAPAGSGDAGKLVNVNVTGTGFEAQNTTIATPGTGDAGKGLKVNSGETGFELSDLTFAEAIAANTTLYLSTTGSDTTGDGSSGSPWYSLKKAIDYLKDKWINADVTVTISIAAGTYTNLDTVYIEHPCASRIEIAGHSISDTTITFGSGKSGIIIQGGTVLGKISDLIIKGANAQAGIYVIKDSHVTLENVRLELWNTCLLVWSNSSAYYIDFGVSNMYNMGYGIFADLNSYVFAQGIQLSSISITGISAISNSAVDAVNADISNTVNGFNAGNNSFINAAVTTVTTFSGDDYNPNVTTGNTPSFGNVGSWIYKP